MKTHFMMDYNMFQPKIDEAIEDGKPLLVMLYMDEYVDFVEDIAGDDRQELMPRAWYMEHAKRESDQMIAAFDVFKSITPA